MPKLIVRDGKYYRMRDGELVEIPTQWVGHTTHSQTIRKRPSKQAQKRRKQDGWKDFNKEWRAQKVRTH